MRYALAGSGGQSIQAHVGHREFPSYEEPPSPVVLPVLGRLRSGDVGLLLFYLGIGAISALVWARLADLSALPSWHADMIGGSAPAPNQYRPLTPWLAHLLMLLIPAGATMAEYIHKLYAVPREVAGIVAAYVALRTMTTALIFISFDRYLRTWFAPPAAAAGSLCLAAILPFTYLHVVQESDPINLLVFILAFWALAEKKDRLLIPLVLLGALNRETVALIPALYLAARLGRRPLAEVLWKAAAIGAAWAAVYLPLVYLVYGRRAYYCDVLMLSSNLSSWVPTAQVLLLFGAMWVLAVVGASRGPLLLRRALWLLPPYLMLHYVVALVIEVRLFLPYAPVIIPLSWWVLFPEARLQRPQPGGKRRNA